MAIRTHRLTADEPRGARRRGQRPEPAGAARGQPGVVHGDHDGDVRRAQGLGHGRRRWRSSTSPPSAARRPFVMHVELPKELPEEQRDRLMQIAAKCPVHRALEGKSCSRRRSNCARGEKARPFCRSKGGWSSFQDPARAVRAAAVAQALRRARRPGTADRRLRAGRRRALRLRERALVRADRRGHRKRRRRAVGEWSTRRTSTGSERMVPQPGGGPAVQPGVPRIRASGRLGRLDLVPGGGAARRARRDHRLRGHVLGHGRQPDRGPRARGGRGALRQRLRGGAHRHGAGRTRRRLRASTAPCPRSSATSPRSCWS